MSEDQNPELIPISMETLAIELETFLQNPKFSDKAAIIKALARNARNPEFDRQKLTRQLSDEGFMFFANKLRSGYYDSDQV